MKRRTETAAGRFLYSMPAVCVLRGAGPVGWWVAAAAVWCGVVCGEAPSPRGAHAGPPNYEAYTVEQQRIQNVALDFTRVEMAVWEAVNPTLDPQDYRQHRQQAMVLFPRLQAAHPRLPLYSVQVNAYLFERHVAERQVIGYGPDRAEVSRFPDF